MKNELMKSPVRTMAKRNTRARLLVWTIVLVIFLAGIGVGHLVGQKEFLGRVKVPAFDTTKVVSICRQTTDERNQLWLGTVDKTTRCVADFQSTVNYRISQASKRCGKTSMILKIIYALAKDKIWGGNATEKLLQDKILGDVMQTVAKFASDLSKIRDDYNRNLRTLMEKGIGRLKQVPDFNIPALTAIVADCQSDGSVDKIEEALFESFDKWVVVAVAFDLVAVLQMQVVSNLARQLAIIAGGMFARHVSTTVASFCIATADGPLPIGDVFAGLGMIYTYWDISKRKAKFRNSVSQTLTSAIQAKSAEVVGDYYESMGHLNRFFDGVFEEIEERAQKEVNNV